MARPKKEPPKTIRKGFRRFLVNWNAISVGYGENSYPVESGRVDLPAGEQWYQYLIDAGLLVPEKETTDES